MSRKQWLVRPVRPQAVRDQLVALLALAARAQTATTA